jgi:hypothetical protein
MSRIAITGESVPLCRRLIAAAWQNPGWFHHHDSRPVTAGQPVFNQRVT